MSRAALFTQVRKELQLRTVRLTSLPFRLDADSLNRGLQRRLHRETDHISGGYVALGVKWEGAMQGHISM